MSRAQPRTVEDCISSWLESKRGRVREPTWIDYREKATRYIAPHLGSARLDDLAPGRLRQFYARLTQGGLSDRSVWYAHELLLQVLDLAVETGHIAMNPARQVRPAAYRRDHAGQLNPVQLARFLKVAAEDSLAALWLLVGGTGLRPSEALALGWEHLDLSRNRVRIEATLRFLGGGRWERYPLRHDGQRREATLSRGVCQALRAHARDQAETRRIAGSAWRAHGLVFTDETGTPLDWKRVTKRHFRPLLVRAGLPAVAPYSLRHSCISLLLASGMDIHMVSRQLGYTSLGRMLENAPSPGAPPPVTLETD